jgi:hypothetical protein
MCFDHADTLLFVASIAPYLPWRRFYSSFHRGWGDDDEDRCSTDDLNDSIADEDISGSNDDSMDDYDDDRGDVAFIMLPPKKAIKRSPDKILMMVVGYSLVGSLVVAFPLFLVERLDYCVRRPCITPRWLRGTIWITTFVAFSTGGVGRIAY